MLAPLATGRSVFTAADGFMLRLRQAPPRTSKSPRMGKVSLLIGFSIDESMMVLSRVSVASEMIGNYFKFSKANLF